MKMFQKVICVNAAEIVSGLSPLQPEKVGIAVGRLMLDRSITY